MLTFVWFGAYNGINFTRFLVNNSSKCISYKSIKIVGQLCNFDMWIINFSSAELFVMLKGICFAI